MFSFEIDDKAVIARLASIPSGVRDALTRKITALRLMLEARVKMKLSGEVLNVRTGALRQSIFSETVATESEIAGQIASSGDVKYARIHEFGGTTVPHDIFPRKGQALKFMVGAETVFAKSVRHPGSVMPERNFMRSALAEMKDEIVAEITKAATDAAKL